MTSLVQNLTMKGMRFTTCAFIPSPRQIRMFMGLVIHIQYFYGRSDSVCLGVVRDTKMVKHSETYRKSRSLIRKQRKGIPGWENSMRKSTAAKRRRLVCGIQGDYPCRPCLKSVDSSLSTRGSPWRCLSGEVTWAEDSGKITVAGMGLMDPKRGCKWGNQLRDHWNSPGRIQLSQCQQEWRWAGVGVRFSGGREERS